MNALKGWCSSLHTGRLLFLTESFCVTFESPGVIPAVRTGMNHSDSEAVSLSCRNEFHTPLAKIICLERCVFMFPQSPALCQFAPNDNVICQAGTADSQMEKNGSHMWRLQIIYYPPQIRGDMSYVLRERQQFRGDRGWLSLTSENITTMPNLILFFILTLL